MRIVSGAMVVVSLVMGVAVSLGEAAKVLDQVSTVPFDDDAPSPARSMGHTRFPFEDRAA